MNKFEYMANLQRLHRQHNPKLSHSKMAEAAGVSISSVRKYRNALKSGELMPELQLVSITTAEPNLVEDEQREEIPIEEEHALKRTIKELKSQVSTLSSKVLDDAKLHDIINKLSSSKRQKSPDWIAPEKKSTKSKAIAVALLGDTHFDEVVFPDQIGGINTYNRQIATQRLHKFFESVLELGQDWLPATNPDGLVLCMLGDMLTGDIHDELTKTNEAALIDSCLYWSDMIISGIELLLPFYKKIHIPCVVGNHGRQSRKPVCKGRVESNWDFLLYSLCSRHFASKGVEDVTFDIPRSADVHFKIFSTRFLATHGDQFRGGSGISGIFAPLMTADSRKRKRQDAVGAGYDVMIMGHWHQTITSGSLIVNGSLKGYDEYAYLSNFGYEDPKQTFFIVDSERGITIQAPIHVTQLLDISRPGRNLEWMGGD